MKRLILLLYACLIAGYVPAQNVPADSIPELPINRPPMVILKLAPFTLLEFQNTFELGAEVRLHNRLGIQGQFGYAPNWLIWPASSSYTARENWRGRIETRWYVSSARHRNRSTTASFPLGQYIAIDALYKQLNTRSQQTIGHECLNGCAYFEKINPQITRYITALGFKIGSQTVMGHRRTTGAPSWLLDTYVGIGLRKAWTSQNSLLQPSDMLLYNGGSSLGLDPFQASDRLLPNFLLGLKIGYTR